MDKLLFLDHHRVIVAVFTQAGCPACEDYAPRFEKVVNGLGLPVFHVGKGRMPDQAALARSCLPVYLIDCDDQQFGDWAEHLSVASTPTTYVLRRPRGLMKVEGDIPDEQVKWLMGRALRGLSCDAL